MGHRLLRRVREGGEEGVDRHRRRTLGVVVEEGDRLLSVVGGEGEEGVRLMRVGEVGAWEGRRLVAEGLVGCWEVEGEEGVGNRLWAGVGEEVLAQHGLVVEVVGLDLLMAVEEVVTMQRCASR